MAENKTKEAINIPDELEAKIEKANQYITEARIEAEKALETKRVYEQEVADLVSARNLANQKLEVVETEILKAEASLNSINSGIKTAIVNLENLNKKITSADSELLELESSKQEIKDRDDKSKTLSKELFDKEKKLNEGIEKVKQILDLLK